MLVISMKPTAGVTKKDAAIVH